MLALFPAVVPAVRHASTLRLRLFFMGPRANTPSKIASPVSLRTENVVYCITCRRCTSTYIGETGRRLRERFSEHLRSIRNWSLGLPVAEHSNSANHTIDDIRVYGVKQCSGSNTSRKRWEMQLIFKLGTVKPGGLNINFSFI